MSGVSNRQACSFQHPDMLEDVLATQVAIVIGIAIGEAGLGYRNAAVARRARTARTAKRDTGASSSHMRAQ